jgi:hypothetical protein
MSQETTAPATDRWSGKEQQDEFGDKIAALIAELTGTRVGHCGWALTVQSYDAAEDSDDVAIFSNLSEQGVYTAFSESAEHLLSKHNGQIKDVLIDALAGALGVKRAEVKDCGDGVLAVQVSSEQLLAATGDSDAAQAESD